MIFARIDVELRDHEKAQRAGTAMGTWTWALLWTRAKERDGFVASEALRGAWAGEKIALRDMATLVSAGLAAVTEGGWLLFGYAEKNETKEQIDQRRAEGRERKQRHVSRKRDGAPSQRPGNALPTRTGTRDERVSNATEPEPEPEPEPDHKPPAPVGVAERSHAFDGAFDGTVDALLSALHPDGSTGLQHRERERLALAITKHAPANVDRVAWVRAAVAEYSPLIDGRYRRRSLAHFVGWLDEGRPKAPAPAKRFGPRVQGGPPAAPLGTSGKPLFPDDEPEETHEATGS